MKLSQDTRDLFAHLWRGGKWSNYGFQTGELWEFYWLQTEKITAPANYGAGTNTFFSVYPTGAKGRTRTTKAAALAVNCLFGEFDQKDGYTLEQVESIDPAPSAIVASGGGWHCYWLLADPFKIESEDDRERIDRIIKRWVGFVGSDPGAKDLARMLRVPGSMNYKYTPARAVEFVRYDRDRLYTLTELVDRIPTEPVKPPKITHDYTSLHTDEVERAATALDRLAPWRCDTYADWVDVGLALSELGDPGLLLWDDWSRKSSKYKADDCTKKWDTFKPGSGKTLASLHYWADEDDPGGRPQRSDYHSPAQLQADLDPPDMPEMAPMEGTTAEPPASLPKKIKKTSWSLDELLATQFQDPNWTVPGRIPEGLVDLCGRPKVGKSWLALNIALGKSRGGKVLDRAVKPGSVLYLALEDNPRRIQARLKMMGATVNGLLQFEFTWKPLHKGGLNDLVVAIESKGYELIVIDTLTRALPGVNHNDENPIGPIMDQLHDIGMNYGITILVVDHTRKANGIYADPIDDVAGSSAKSKPLDAVLAIYKSQGKPGATLVGRGKDIEEFEDAMTFDINTGTWQVLGDAGAVALTHQRREIVDAVKALGKTPFSPIQKATGIEKGNLSRQLAQLVEIGALSSEMIGGRLHYYV